MVICALLKSVALLFRSFHSFQDENKKLMVFIVCFYQLTFGVELLHTSCVHSAVLGDLGPDVRVAVHTCG